MGFESNDKSLITSPEYLTYHRYSNVHELNTVRWNFQGRIFCSESYHVTPSHRYVPCAVLSHSVVSDSATPWTVARQAPLFMGFSSQEY